jgi:hypothetical protein
MPSERTRSEKLSRWENGWARCLARTTGGRPRGPTTVPSLRGGLKHIRCGAQTERLGAIKKRLTGAEAETAELKAPPELPDTERSVPGGAEALVAEAAVGVRRLR